MLHLCEKDCCCRKFARDLYSYAMFLQEGLRVKTVVICQVLRRHKIPYPEYNDKVVETNIALKSLVDNSELPVVFWRQRGLWNSPDPIFRHDGIHLSWDIGYPKYLRSLRDCIIRACRWFGQHEPAK
ncbi:hypothetical protein ACF0H5_018383 [Mactra antiquata]